MKRIITLVMVAIMMVTAVGCGGEKDPLDSMSKKELIEFANTLVTDVDAANARIDELETTLKGVTDYEVPQAAIEVLPDGTGRETFKSIDGLVKFPVPFEYPGSTQAPNTSSVSLTQNIKFVPTPNWLIRQDGTKVELNHTTDIQGVIKAGAIKEMYSREEMEGTVFGTFFAGWPATTITYNRLFLDDQWWGMQAKCSTRIDGGPAQFVCGMLGLGEQCFTYMFLYSGEPDKVKDETILSLLKTVKMLNRDLRVE